MATSFTNPEFRYYSARITITDGTNDEFVFTEGAGNLTAVLTAGTYFWAELAAEIKRAMQTAGALTYTVTYDESTRKYTIAGSSNFTLDVGAAGADDALPSLGFTVDVSSTTSATSDTAVPSQTTFSMTSVVYTRARRPRATRRASRETTRLDSGRRASTYHGSEERLTFIMEFVSLTDTQSLWDLFANVAEFGNSFDFYPDESNNSDYATVYWDAEEFPGIEQTDRNVYRLFAIEMELVFKVPAAGTLTARSFLDRGPTS